MASRHVFIAGSSFSGSTLVNLCLGSLPGCVGLDETNWLVPKPGIAVPEFHFEESEYEPACRGCRGECPYLTRDLRESLQQDPTQWLAKLGSQFPGQTIVTAEKSISNLETIYPGGDHDMLVLFRHPITAWKSLEKRPWKQIGKRQALNRWMSGYQELFERPVSGRKVFLELEALTSRPIETMQELTEALALPYSDSFLRYWEVEQHYVGGNFDLRVRVDEQPERLGIQNTAPQISARAEARITENRPGLMSLYHQMRSQAIGRQSSANE